MTRAFVMAQVLLLIIALLTAAGCAAKVNPAVADAQLALRVKTSLLNDPGVGTLPIDVQAVGGVVTLTGQVPSAGDVQRTVELTRSVSGVVEVVSALTIENAPPLPASPQVSPEEPPGGPSSRRGEPPRLIGLGVSVSATPMRGDSFGMGRGVGPILRLPIRNGLVPTIGFSWTELPIDSSPQGTPGLAHLRLRPVMAGAAWGRSAGRTAASVSLVGGWSFNDIRADPSTAGPFRAVHTTGSFVWRPGVTLWQDVSDRYGVNVFVGGLFTSPTVTFAADAGLVSRRLPSRALIVSAGFARWIF